MRVLNRVVEWTPNGINYEADQRHAEIICQELGLKDSSKGVVTPGIKQKLTKKEGQSALQEGGCNGIGHGE